MKKLINVGLIIIASLNLNATNIKKTDTQCDSKPGHLYCKIQLKKSEKNVIHFNPKLFEGFEKKSKIKNTNKCKPNQIC